MRGHVQGRDRAKTSDLNPRETFYGVECDVSGLSLSAYVAVIKGNVKQSSFR